MVALFSSPFLFALSVYNIVLSLQGEVIYTNPLAAALLHTTVLHDLKEISRGQGGAKTSEKGAVSHCYLQVPCYYYKPWALVGPSYSNQKGRHKIFITNWFKTS